MNMEISGHHLALTDSLRRHVHSKLERALHHLDEPPTRCEVLLSVEKDRHSAEIRLHLPKRELFAKDEEANMYAAIDAAADKINRQVRDIKGRARAAERGRQ